MTRQSVPPGSRAGGSVAALALVSGLLIPLIPGAGLLSDLVLAGDAGCGQALWVTDSLVDRLTLMPLGPRPAPGRSA